MQFSSVQDGINALGKAHMHSTPSLKRFPNAAFQTVPVFVRLTMALSSPFREDRLALPLYVFSVGVECYHYSPAARLCLLQYLAEKVKLSQLEPLIWAGVDKGTRCTSLSPSLGFCRLESELACPLFHARNLCMVLWRANCLF